MSTLTKAKDAPTALVAEDHPTTRKLLSTWLKMSGYSVESAANGEQAWRIAQASCPPIVVADWSMPGMSGVDLCRSIRKVHPKHDIFILIATARDNSEDVAVAMEAGANDFVAKPINEQEFIARIHSAAFSLEELRSQAQLADTDPLTGLFNRRFFDIQCQQQIQRSRDFGTPLSCIVIDVDHFKHLNDSFGHAVGDKVLTEVADVLSQETRQSDLICRRGGDEFCVLLAQSSEERAAEVGQRIRCQLAQRLVEVDDESLKQPTIQVTIGVAGRTPIICTAEQLVDAADQVLIKAKNAGRNRVLTQRDLDLTESETLSHRSVQVGLHKALARDIMSHFVAFVHEDQPLLEVHRLVLETSVDCVPVVDRSSKLIGMIGERDLMHAFSTNADMQTPIRSFMSMNVARFHELTPVAEIWECLRRSPMLRVMIVKDEVPTGFVGRRALLKLIHGQ